MNTSQAPAYMYNINLQDCAHGDDELAETKKLFVDLASLVIIATY